ncbi:MAG: dTDP-4-dehydrorhamnose 3,5-epimerase family protein [Fimbriimonadales bacterium]|nr:dTDP-4-dehydrorhamnose 3,5-epimerase family protein [Fimbriimonadales bacterium]
MWQEVLPGVLLRELTRHSDARGWLIELFRADELPEGFRPVMGYISLTRPGVVRGPHEHLHQTDGFAFLWGDFRVYLWDARAEGKPTRITLDLGEKRPAFLIVPPGVVHAYQNVGSSDALVLNFPDRLYAGWGRAERVDEIRHEEDPESPYRIE